MSTVTNVILTTGLGEAEHGTAIALIQDWLAADGHPHLRRVDELVNPGKAMEAEVWIGAFNGLRLEEFLQLVKWTRWLAIDEMRIFWKRQDDEAFYPAFSRPL